MRLEQQIRDIFNKQSISASDVRRANALIDKWKLANNWKERTELPIKA